MFEWIRVKLNERHDRNIAYQRRVDNLRAFAGNYSLPEVLEYARTNVFKLTPGEGVSQGRGWMGGEKIDYIIATDREDSKRRKGKREPLFSASIMQTVQGKRMMRGESRSHSDIGFYNIFTIQLTESGEFFGLLRGENLVSLGTTRTIRGVDDLQAALDKNFRGRRIEWMP